MTYVKMVYDKDKKRYVANTAFQVSPTTKGKPDDKSIPKTSSSNKRKTKKEEEEDEINKLLGDIV